MNGQGVSMCSVSEISPGIRAGFTDVAAGNLAFHVSDEHADVALRRKAVNTKLRARIGPGVDLAYMHQVHGTEVAVLDSDGFTGNGHPIPGAAFPTADAMVAVGEGAAARGLAVMVADCVPVVLAARCAGDGPAQGEPIVAVAHAGRPGVEQGVIAAVVGRMRAAGAGNIAAWLGPSVCGRCYEVPEAMRARVGEMVPETFASTSWGTPALDLPAGVLAQLAALGVAARPSGICTLEDPRWYSHRRSQRDHAPEGRFIGFVAADH